MVPLSDNVRRQRSHFHPRKLDPNDFVPSERAFPFCNIASGGNDSDKLAFIEIGEDYVTFRMQRGPIKEHGINGCQIDDIVKFCVDTITVLNKKFSCRENSLAITKLEEAWLWLQARKMDREARNVEGRDKD